MKIEAEKLQVYAVTDRKWLKEGETLAQIVEKLIIGGAGCVQLREKNESREEILKEAKALKKVCRKYGVPLIINDSPQLAREAAADGVHVGLEDMEIQRAREYLGGEFMIGASAHNVAEALQAEAAGADYIGCGAVFGSTTKTNVSRLAKEELAAICQAVTIPVVAIGGITRENIGELGGTGISGVAVVGALFGAEDHTAAARQLKIMLQRCCCAE